MVTLEWKGHRTTASLEWVVAACPKLSLICFRALTSAVLDHKFPVTTDLIIQVNVRTTTTTTTTSFWNAKGFQLERREDLSSFNPIRKSVVCRKQPSHSSPKSGLLTHRTFFGEFQSIFFSKTTGPTPHKWCL